MPSSKAIRTRPKSRARPRKWATIDATSVPGSRPGKLPDRIEPQLAQLVDSAPAGDEYLLEIKLDGYRLGARLDRGRVTLLTRKGLDWTAKFPVIASAVAKLPADAAWIDGGACHVEEDDRTSFSGLQDDLGSGRAERVWFFAFDLLHIDGADLRPRQFHPGPKPRSSCWMRTSMRLTRSRIEASSASSARVSVSPLPRLRPISRFKALEQQLLARTQRSDVTPLQRDHGDLPRSLIFDRGVHQRAKANLP
jgi:hypothetical protein